MEWRLGVWNRDSWFEIRTIGMEQGLLVWNRDSWYKKDTWHEIGTGTVFILVWKD